MQIAEKLAMQSQCTSLFSSRLFKETKVCTLSFQIDNIIVLSDGMNLNNEEGRMMTDFLSKYRRLINPNLMFVSVDLSGSSAG